MGNFNGYRFYLQREFTMESKILLTWRREAKNEFTELDTDDDERALAIFDEVAEQMAVS